MPARRAAGGSRRGLTGRAAREGQPPARLLAALRLAGVPPQRWRAAQRGPFERPFPPSIDPFDRPWPRIFPYLRYLRKIRHHLYTPFSHHLILEPFPQTSQTMQTASPQHCSKHAPSQAVHTCCLTGHSYCPSSDLTVPVRHLCAEALYLSLPLSIGVVLHEVIEDRQLLRGKRAEQLLELDPPMH